MRRLGSQSLKLLCSLDLDVLGPKAVEKAVSGRLLTTPDSLADGWDRQSKLLQAVDGTDIHGGLLALSEVAAAYKERCAGSDLDHTAFLTQCSSATQSDSRLRELGLHRDSPESCTLIS